MLLYLLDLTDSYETIIKKYTPCLANNAKLKLCSDYIK